MLLTVILIIISRLSPTHSFIPGLKPSFSANSSHSSLPFLLQAWLCGFPRLFTVTSEHIRFLLFRFFLFYTFLLSVPCGRLSWLMSAFERTLNSNSYRIDLEIDRVDRFSAESSQSTESTQVESIDRVDRANVKSSQSIISTRSRHLAVVFVTKRETNRRWTCRSFALLEKQ